MNGLLWSLNFSKRTGILCYPTKDNTTADYEAKVHSRQIVVSVLTDWLTDLPSPTHQMAKAERTTPRCWPHENHSHAEFISAVVTQNHGWNFNNCRPQLSKQLHWNLIPVDFSFVLCQRRVLIRLTKTTRVPALMDVRGEEGEKAISGWTRTWCWKKKTEDWKKNR